MAYATTIRAPVAADHVAWKALWDGYNAFYNRAGPRALPEAVIASTWARILDPTEPVHALVAERDGRLVGLAHYLYHRTTTAVADTCYLQDLYTDTAARGQGIARKLIEAVYERARSAGAARVYWQTHESNAVARRLYDRVAENSGFIVYRHPLEGN